MQSGDIQSDKNRVQGTQWVAYCALFISLMTFLFGNDVARRLAASFPTSQDTNKTIVEGLIALLNIALAVFVLADLRFIRPIKLSDDNSPASGSFKQLLNGWQLLWLTWLLLYCCLAVIWFQLFSGNKNVENLVWFAANGLNMLSGFFFFYLFFILDQPSIPTEDEPERAKSFNSNLIITFLIGLSALVLSSVLIALWDKPDEASSQSLSLIRNLVPAYVAVGMAFFFGRLDSHYLQLKRVTLAPLYLYAVIQLFWDRKTLIDKPNYETIAVFGLALILKFVIFYYISNLIRDEKFRQYFVATEKEFKNQES